MLFMAFFSWWYNRGWLSQVAHVKENIAAAADMFSVQLLILTLFSPFRQISAGRADGPLGVILRAWLDRMISRFIGALVRSFMIVLGSFYIAGVSALGAARIVLWPLLPILPVILIVVALTGWTP